MASNKVSIASNIAFNIAPDSVQHSVLQHTWPRIASNIGFNMVPIASNIASKRFNIAQHGPDSVQHSVQHSVQSGLQSVV